MASIVILNNKIGYIVEEGKDLELSAWLKENGKVADRELVSKLSRKPLSPDFSIDPEIRCPITRDTTCEFLYFPRK